MMARDSTTDLVATLTQAKLVRLNRVSLGAGALAGGVVGRVRATGLSYSLRLRPNVTFSDGHPFTADDVLFSFEAVYDQKVGSVLADALLVGDSR